MYPHNYTSDNVFYVIEGEADVIQQFDITEKRKKIVVAGLRVTKGEIVKSENVKLIRDHKVLYEGKYIY